MATLYLIPTTLAQTIEHHVLISQQWELIKDLKHFIVETPKIGRSHLKALNLSNTLQNLNIMELNKHHQQLEKLIAPLLEGHDLGLLSDCGSPAIADPGSAIVRLAQIHHITVYPLTGPNSLIMALMSSGLNGQNFKFNGYLPFDDAIISKLKNLERLVILENSSQIFIETPFRAQKLLQVLLNNLDLALKLCLAIELMSPEQQILTKSIKQWRAQTIDLTKKEVVFIIGN